MAWTSAHRRRGGSRTRAGVWAATALAAGQLALAETQPAVSRVFLLPAPDRASLVVDLVHEVEQTKVALASPDAFVVDLGPIRGPVAARAFRAAAPATVVRAVTIERLPQRGAMEMLRVRVDLATPASGRVRVAGNRVYLDFTPERPESSGQVAAGTSGALQSWEAALLRRAAMMAREPDVRGVERLRLEWLRRSPAAGHDATTLARLDALLEEARRAQLAEDARLIREAAARDPDDPA